MRVVIDKKIRNNLLVIRLGAPNPRGALLGQKTKNSNRTQNLIAVMRRSATILLSGVTKMGAVACGYFHDYVAFQDGSYLLRIGMPKSAGINYSQNSWVIAMLLQARSKLGTS